MESKSECNVSDCIKKIDARLLEAGHNAEVSKTWAFSDTGMYTTVLIPLTKIDKTKRGKIPAGMQPSHCPFCGGKRI